MLLRDRKRLNQQTGEMEGGTPPLVFNGGLPDVQINDPRIPLAEALAKIPKGIAKGVEGYAAGKTMAANQAGKKTAAAPASDPYGLGTGDLNLGLPAPQPTVSGGASVGTEEEDPLKKILGFLTRATA